MDAEKVMTAIAKKDYSVREESGCGCYIGWNIRNGELRCDVDHDSCYEERTLIIGGDEIARYIRFEGLEEETYNVQSGNVKSDNEDVRNAIIKIIGIEDSSKHYEHIDGKTHANREELALKEFITEKVDEGWKLFRDNERGFGNEYTMILFSPNAGENEVIEDHWDKVEIDEWIENALWRGNPMTHAFVHISVIE